MDAIARLPAFDQLSRVPGAQIPWVGARAPAALREMLWGVRSGMDQLLIRAMMWRETPQARQRVLRSLDYVREYRREETVPRVRDWFSGRWCDGDSYVRTVQARGGLASWPLINVDIVAPANVSLTLDLCRPD